MSQKHVELLIGRLLTDEELRRRFSQAPLETLTALADEGWDLTRGEIEALVQTDVQLWSRVAAKLPSRIQRCSLRTDALPPDQHAKG
jgi:hypothetical protein